MQLRRTVIVPYSAAAMFDLADDIESYPKFLPWCDAADVLRDGEQVIATLHIQYCGLKTKLKTRNRHKRPQSIRMELAGGPLRSLQGGWEFVDLGDGRCRVEFALDYQFGGGVLGRVFARVFDAVFGKFLDNFVSQANIRYGGEAMTGNIRVAIADSNGEKQLILAEGATVADALKAGGYENVESAGIFGRVCSPQTPLTNGTRVEIYEPLANDPRQRRRSRANS